MGPVVATLIRATGGRYLAGQSAQADRSATAPVHFYPERTVDSTPGKRQATDGTRPTVSV
jgi:hypothetical protein